MGIEDQGMVEERRHSYHEVQEVLRMLGENYLGCTNRMENYAGWEQNQDSWGPSDLRGHARRGMGPPSNEINGTGFL
jgi:hypothetical protein